MDPMWLVAFFAIQFDNVSEATIPFSDDFRVHGLLLLGTVAQICWSSISLGLDMMNFFATNKIVTTVAITRKSNDVILFSINFARKRIPIHPTDFDELL